MAIIQPQLYSWKEVEATSEIKRFTLILESLDDEELMRALEEKRGKGRNDYPIRAVWNSIIAALVFRHPSRPALIAELKRNGEVRDLCGFDPVLGEKAVPPRFCYIRFHKSLLNHIEMVEKIFFNLVALLSVYMPEFGERLAADSKALRAAGKHDKDASVGTKTTLEEAEEDQKITVQWLGYKLHMLCDVETELPVAFEVTKADVGDSPRLMPLLEKHHEDSPETAARAAELSADRAYDDGADKAEIFDEYGVAPLIPPRDFSDGAMKPLNEKRSDTLFVSGTGEVCCRIKPFAEKDADQFCAMQFQGFEEDRKTLKFRCPAAAFGVECANQNSCASLTKDTGFGRVVRVPLEKDRRVFLPVHFHSGTFRKRYAGRTSVERLFSRLDNLFFFEKPPVLGLARMRLRVLLTLIAMLAIAVGWIEMGQPENIRKIRAA